MLALPAVRVFTRALYRCIAVAQEAMEWQRRVARTTHFPRVPVFADRRTLWTNCSSGYSAC